MTARFITSMLRGRSSALVALAIAFTVATTAHASIIFTSNLSDITTPSPNPNGNQFQLGYDGGSVAGITNTNDSDGNPGYNFIFQSAFKSWFNGASSDSGNVIQLDSNVMADSADPTQDGGYFLALDSVFENSAIDISIPTIAGDMYSVTFDWAGVQQQGYTGTTTDALSVALNGGTAQTTGSVSVAEQGFSGWATVTDTFTAATTGTEILSFLASGTPTGANQEPAMTLLDNISVSQSNSAPPPPPLPTPEPSSLLLLATGLIGTAGVVRYRLVKSEATNL